LFSVIQRVLTILDHYGHLTGLNVISDIIAKPNYVSVLDPKEVDFIISQSVSILSYWIHI